MGLKSGSRDAGLDDEEEQEVSEDNSGSPDDSAHSQNDATPGGSEPPESESTGTGETATGGRPSIDSIPYKLRRDKVNEGRQQVPYFLRDEVIAAEDEMQDELEALLGEDVYKSDYREAAMVVAQRNPELVAEVLREWGYDLN